MASSRGRASVFPLLFIILWMTVLDVADGTHCAMNCASSNGISVGAACVFTIDEELPADTTITTLVIDGCGTPRLKPIDNADDAVLEYIGLAGFELKLIRFADLDAAGTQDGEQGFLYCDTDVDMCRSPFVVSVEFRNLDEYNLVLSTNSSQATVTELIPYTEEFSLPITVDPELFATDEDKLTGISYVINAIDGDVTFFRFADKGDSDSDSCFASGEKPVLVVDGAHTFDFEETPVIHLNVSIRSHHDDVNCDESSVVRTEYSSLDVFVTDLDDQPPIFNATSYNYKASENSTAFSHVEGIYAYDQDTGIDADIIYSLETDGLWDCTAYVEIDSQQANVTITQPFDFEEGYSECRLTILATQADNEIQTATASLIIEISDVNDNCPLPVPSATIGSYVNGDAFVSDPESLGRLTVTISDMDKNISYEGPEFLSNKFVLTPASEASSEYYIAPNQTVAGQIETGENVTISVTDALYDGSDCSKTTTIEVVVVPLDVQDPTFDQADGYHVTVEEKYEGFLIQVAANNSDGNNEGIVYSLPERNGIYFTIDAETGNITLIVGFDFEVTTVHTLTVRATDARWETIERYADTNVVITITDINDNLPVIEGGPLILSIPESTPVGTTVAVVQASDADADSELSYTFTDTPDYFPLEINSTTGAISTTKILDADGGEEYVNFNANITVSDGNATSSGSLDVTILDINDNFPAIVTNLSNLAIIENDAGPLLLNISIEDDDLLAENQLCVLSLTGIGNYNISIEPSTDTMEGILVIYGPFDREMEDEIQFTLKATNTAPPNLESSQLVTVTVLDVNDRTPAFTEETGFYCKDIEVFEAETQEGLCVFVATDDDQAESDNAEIEYSIDNTEFFSINSSTGELSLIEELDRESISSITITVTASDMGVPIRSDTMDVIITIQGINDNVPVFNFSQSNETIHEETSVNSKVAILTASDADLPVGDPIYYQAVEDDDTDWDTFYLRSEMGDCEVYLMESLDVRRSPYKLIIEANDGMDSEEGYNSTMLWIYVEPRSVCDISVGDPATSIVDDIDLRDDLVVADINASSSCDPSESGITYSKTGESFLSFEGVKLVSTDHFAVDNETGEVSVIVSEDIDIGNYTIMILAKNGSGSPLDQSQAETQIIITVNDTNNNCPVFESSSHDARYSQGDAFLSESGSAEWLIITVTDPDTVFVGDISSLDEARFNMEVLNSSSSNTLLLQVGVIGTLSADTDLTVYVDDGDNCTDSTTVIITVAATLAPSFNQTVYQAAVLETSPTNTMVTQVFATNEDNTTDHIEYEIIDPANTPFKITSTEGVIQVAFNGIDYEALNSYNLTITATDTRWSEQRYDTAQVLVTVTDVNEFLPVFSGLPATVPVQENFPVNDTVYILRAYDGDVEDMLEYSLVKDGDGLFTVNPISGHVSTTAELDYDAGNVTFPLVAMVSDGANNVSGDLTIIIMDINDNPPVIAEPIIENRPEHSELFSIMVDVTDPDTIGDITLRLSVDTPEGFSITQEGNLTFDQEFDQETQDYYSFFVIANDGIFETWAQVQIFVEDINDNAPRIQDGCGELSIPEDYPVGDTVCTITATDKDKPDTPNSDIAYSIVSEQEFFSINSSTGVLSLIEELDRESDSSITFTVMASDGGLPSLNDTMIVTINIQGVNDNVPEFTSGEFNETVHEETLINSRVATLTAIDADVPVSDPVYYLTVGGDESDWDTFYLRTEKGVCKVYLEESLDVARSPYKLIIEANDGMDSGEGYNSTMLWIYVAPRSACDISVDDLVTSIVDDVDLIDDLVVADINASSTCDPSESGITYSKTSEYLLVFEGVELTSTDHFAVNNKTGEVSVILSEDIKIGNYTIMILAKNETGSPLDQSQAETQVVITVNDTNDNCPVFESSSYDARYSRGDAFLSESISAEWLIITVTDSDTVFDGVFSLSDEDAFSLTQLNPSSSNTQLLQVGVIGPISGNTNLTVSVDDGDNCTDSTTVSITVAATLAPSFSQTVYHASVPENSLADTIVIQVFATNEDNTTEEIEYEIIDPADTPFKISLTEGVIQVAFDGLDYEAQNSYNLTITATDTRWSEQRYDTAHVLVNVTDMNEFEPEFLGLPATVSIQESLPAKDTVYILRAYDGDVDDILEYSLLEDGDGLFAVDSVRGHVTTTKALDYDTGDWSFPLVAVVSDGNTNTTNDLTISVLDVNDNPPLFPEPIIENRTEHSGLFSINVNATDLDTVGGITFSLSDDTPEGFEISKEGDLTFDKEFDRETHDYYSFFVIADDGVFKTWAQVQIFVEDINDNAPEIQDGCGELSIPEDYPVGDTVCTIVATDEDKPGTPNSEITYSISEQDQFAINALTGVITLKVVLDREVEEEYKLTVEASDNGEPSKTTEATITVRVTDVNDVRPVFVTPSPSTKVITNDTLPWTQIFELKAEDKDLFPYNISTCVEADPWDPVWGNFTIVNEGSGVCLIKNLLKFSEEDRFQMGVMAVDVDDNSLSDTVNLTVRVVSSSACTLEIDVGPDLDFEEEALTDSSTVNTVNATASCNDTDIRFEIIKQTFTSAISGISEAVGMFIIDESSGDISVNSTSPLPGEYELEVEAITINSSVPTYDRDELLITIIDINNNCPEFLNTTLEAVYANGDDIAYEVYSTDVLRIVAVDGDQEFIGTFDVNSSMVSLAVDESSPNSRSVSVTLYPGANGDFTIQITLSDANLTDCSEHIEVNLSERLPSDLSPVFGKYNYSAAVPEDAESGTTVLTVDATGYDGDTEMITYRFDDEVQDSFFTIDSATGEIITGDRGLDYESERKFDKVVIASDTRWDPPRSSNVDVTISILDVDEFDLELAAIPVIRAQENVLIGTVIYTAWATDSDGSSGDFVFSLEDPTNTFQIDSDSGQISTTGALDAEDVSEYLVNVTVRDDTWSDTDYQVVNITIVDLNDNIPVFNQMEYSLEIPENEEGTYSLMVYASDNDTSSDNSRIMYALEKKPDDRFSIDGNTGIITVDTSGDAFDREEMDMYEVTVVASDAGDPSLSTAVPFAVIVLDENDNAPEFATKEEDVYVPENENGAVIATFSATDADEGDNAAIVYTLEEDGGTPDKFTINPMTGAVTVRTALNREEEAEYLLTVTATDGGDLTDTLQINVYVSDVNDNTPIFLEPSPPPHVESDATEPGSEIFAFEVQDLDEFPFNIWRCEPEDADDHVWGNFTLITDQSAGLCIIRSLLWLVAGQEFEINLKVVDVNNSTLPDLNKSFATLNIEVLGASECRIDLDVGPPLSFVEGQLKGNDLVVMVNATSTCSGSDFVFEITQQQFTDAITGSEGSVDAFIIDETNGVITVNSSSPPSGDYDLVIEASNSSFPLSHDTEYLRITINDTNNNCPSFSVETLDGVYAVGDTTAYQVNSPDILIITVTDEDQDFEGTFTDDSDVVDVVDAAGPSTNTRFLSLQINELAAGNFTIQINVSDPDAIVPDCLDTMIVNLFQKPILDLSPEFLLGNYEEQVMENITAGTFILRVEAKGFDGDTSKIVYKFSDEDDYFLIDGASGDITAGQRGLDYESKEKFVKVVTASDERWDPPRSTEVDVNITLIDVDEFPLVLGDIPDISVQENTAVGTVIYKAWATDSDGSSDDFVFSLHDPTSTFTIDPSSGEIQTQEPLDSETTSVYNVTVMVEDSSMSASDSQSISITISDVNDHQPSFDQTSYTITIEEEQQGIYNLMVYAIDEDQSSPNNAITYSLENTLNDRLSIDPDTGNITIDTNGDKVFNREEDGDSYSVTVTATDDGSPKLTSSSIVVIEIEDINDNRPVFTEVESAVHVDENQADVVIATVSASDLDAGENSHITYTLEEVGGDSGTFRINSTSGVINLIKPLNREIQDVYELTVTATDGGAEHLSDTEYITVHVNDVNDEPPTFVTPAPPVEVISDDTQPGTVIFRLEVEDLDLFPNNLSRCEQESPSDPDDAVWGNFTIVNEQPGICEVRSLVQLSAGDTFEMQVKAVDLDDSTLSDPVGSSATLTVRVLDAADCWIDLDVGSDLTFDEEDLVANDTVVTVNATSTCSGTDFVYEITQQVFNNAITGESADVYTFVIGEDSGEIAVNSSSPSPLPGIYRLMVKASNSSSPFSYSIEELLITISDINNNCPEFVPTSLEAVYAEGDGVAYQRNSPDIWTIVAVDADKEFIGAFSDNSADVSLNAEPLSLNSRSLTLVIAPGTTGNIDVQIEVSDTGCSNSLTVNLLEENVTALAPVFMQESYTEQVAENTDPETFILTVEARGYDGDDSAISYKFVEGNTYFVINPTSGVITTGQRGLDYETEFNFTKVVIASDERWAPPRESQVTVTILVEDLDEFPLELVPIPDISVQESVLNGSVIYTAWATDSDGSSGDFVFSLVDPSDTFRINPDSGEIFTYDTLNAEDMTEYDVTVTVEDNSSSASANQEVVITVADVNDNKPIFDETRYSTEITEEESGVYYLQVHATDEDLTSPNYDITYALESTLEGRLSVDPITGNITINTETKLFDREEETRYEVVVTATDGGNPPLFSSVTVELNILDVNDNPPVFDEDKLKVEVEEDKAGGVLIATISASDPDDGDNGDITYTLEEDGGVPDDFAIGSSTGELTTVNFLDREDRAIRYLTIYAFDGGDPVRLNSSMLVEVTVLDVNDNAPVFVAPFKSTIHESTAAGSTVIQVTATDDDVYPNDIIMFTQVDSGDEGWNVFSLQNTQDGTFIVLIDTLAPQEPLTTYSLGVRASDPENEKTTTQLYMVTVVGGSFCYVTFPETTYELKNLTSDFVKDETFLTINANSSCDGEDFVLEIASQTLMLFNETSTTEVETFSLSPNGHLSSNADGVDPGFYRITVVAFNSSDTEGDKINIEDAMVEITAITMATNNPPEVLNGGDRVQVVQPKLEGEELLQIIAIDPDDPYSGNAILSYTEISEITTAEPGVQTDYFRVNSNDGMVSAKVNLLEIPDVVVNLTFSVIDSGLPPLETESFILVELLLPTYDNAPPVLTADCESVTSVPENTIKGTVLCSVMSDREVTYVLTGGDGMFNIDSIDGYITVVNPLDYEDSQEHSVIINATTTSITQLSSTLQILFKVGDINEFPPSFDQVYPPFLLSEDSGKVCPAYDFGVVSATDNDGSVENSRIVYSISGDPRFRIDNTSGVISKTEGCIDVEVDPSDQNILLTVTTSNEDGNPPLESIQIITVSIADINDHPPELSVIGESEFQANESIPGQLLFELEYSDSDVTIANQESEFTRICSMGEDCEYFVFTSNGTVLSIYSSDTQPTSSGDIQIIVTVTNTAFPPLSDSATLTVIYSSEPVYFPEDRLAQSVTIEEDNNKNVSLLILGPVGMTGSTQFSVLENEGADCSELFVAFYDSVTYVHLVSTRPLDYESSNGGLILVWVAESTTDDACSPTRRKRRQTTVEGYTIVTIVVEDQNDEPPSFTDFTLATDSRRYYLPVHVSRTLGEKVYDLSLKVDDEDTMTNDHVYQSEGNDDTVAVMEDGDVIINEHLSSDDVTGVTASISVTVTDDSAEQSSAQLMLRVMSDEDIYVATFDWAADEGGVKRLSELQACITQENIHIFTERVVKSGASSELWLYGIDDGSAGGTEDFVPKTTLQGYIFEDCEGEEPTEKPSEQPTDRPTEELRTELPTGEPYVQPWSPSQIAVFILALFILIGAIVLTLYLLTGDPGKETPPSSHDSEDGVSQEPILSESSEPTPEPTPEPSPESSPELGRVAELALFERINREKGTSLYGSAEAIIDLMSEMDAVSLSERDPPEEITSGELSKEDSGGQMDEVSKVVAGKAVAQPPNTEGSSGARAEPISDEDEPLRPYAEYKHPPPEEYPGGHLSGDASLKDQTSGTDASLKDLLTEYDNPAFDGKEEPGQLGQASKAATDKPGSSSNDAGKLQETGTGDTKSSDDQKEVLKMKSNTMNSRASSSGAPQESVV